MKFKVDKRARFTSSMVAGVAIIALAVWGWGLPITTVVTFFVICLGFLVVIIGVAALLGYVIKRLRNDGMDDD